MRNPIEKFSASALEGRIPLREGEITLQEAFRRLELPMYGVVAAAARVAGWSFDLYQAFHGRIFDPNVVSTSLLIKYLPPVATGAAYFDKDESHTWGTLAGLHIKSELFKHNASQYFQTARKDPQKFVSEPLKNGFKDGIKYIRNSLHKLREVSDEREVSWKDKVVTIGVGGIRFSTDFTYRTAKLGFNVLNGTLRYGYESGKEVVSVGSRVWFINRSIRRISPIVNAVDDILAPRFMVDLPLEFEHALIDSPYRSAEIRRL